MKTSFNILFPVYNEEKRLEQGIRATEQYLSGRTEAEYVLTIVDNASVDATQEIAERLCQEFHGRVRYIRITEKGVGAAFRAGVAGNSCDVVGYMDVDLSTDISHVLDMMAAFEENPSVAVVNASRWSRDSDTSGRKFYRNITSIGLVVILKLVFGMKASDARDVFAEAVKRRLFVAEAVWTRFMPMAELLSTLCEKKYVGRVHALTANLGYPVYHQKERVRLPELGGGALLDVGIYPLTFASIVFGDDIAGISSDAIFSDTGVDVQNSMTLKYRDGRQAVLNSTVLAHTDRQGVLYCENGYILVENINNFESIQVFGNDRKLIKRFDRPKQLTGYEYEVRAAAKAIQAGALECPEIPHAKTVHMMTLMDQIRHQWSFWYPGEKQPGNL